MGFSLHAGRLGGEGKKSHWGFASAFARLIPLLSGTRCASAAAHHNGTTNLETDKVGEFVRVAGLAWTSGVMANNRTIVGGSDSEAREWAVEKKVKRMQKY